MKRMLVGILTVILLLLATSLVFADPQFGGDGDDPYVKPVVNTVL